jgi:hypothetical protein
MRYVLGLFVEITCFSYIESVYCAMFIVEMYAYIIKSTSQRLLFCITITYTIEYCLSLDKPKPRYLRSYKIIVGKFQLKEMSTSLPIKCHLPLITTRIEFQFNILSPPPHITPRRDLGAVIRRQVRRATPYVRSNRRNTPRRAESPTSDLSEEDTSEEEEETSSHKILKPKGEVGKSNSGGYNLQAAIGWEDKEFARFIVSQVVHCYKNHQITLNRNTSTMKLERDLLLRFVTVSRIARSWTKLFNQYVLGHVFKCLSYI